MSASNASAPTPRPRAGGRLLRVAVWLAIAVALFALLGFFVAPGLIKSQLENLLTERTHRKVTVERVRFNPFTLSASVQGFVMRERDAEAPFVTFDELFVDASAASIYRRAPVFDRVRLARPHLRVVRHPDRRYNFQDLLDEALNAPASDQPPPGFSLNNIEIVDGRIDFDDRPESKRHEVTDIGIGIPFLSNLPHAVDIEVQPALTARVNGSPLELKGETKPFKDTRETSLALDFDRIDLPRYADYSPVPLPVKLAAGELDTQLTLRFATRADNELQALTLAGGAELRGLALADRAGAPVASVVRLQADLEVFDAVANVLKLKSVVIEQPVVHVTRQGDGSINLLALLPPPAAAKPGDKPAKPLQYGFDRLAVIDGQLKLVDRQPVNRPFETDIRKVNIEVANLSSASGARAKVRAGYETTTGAAFSYDGDLQVEPVAAAGRIQVKSFLLAELFPYYEDLLDLQVDDGKLDLEAKVTLAATGPPLDVRLTDIHAVLRSLKLTFPGQKTPQWQLATAEVRRGTVDLARQRISLGEVSARDGVAYIRREADGTFNFARIFKVTAQTGKEAAPPADAAGWVVEAEQVRFGRFRAVYDDLALPKPIKLVAEPIDGTYRNYSNARGAKGTLDVRATLNGKGRLAVSGPVTINPVAGDVRVDLRGFALPPLQPFLDEVVNVEITDGAVQAKGRLSFAVGDGKPAGSFSGDVDITGFASIDKPTQASLLQWQSLHLGSVRARIEPLQVSVDEVALADFYSRLILNADGTLNVQNLLARPGNEKAAAAVRADGTAGEAPTSASEPPPQEGFFFGAPEGRPSGDAPRSGGAARTAPVAGSAPGRMPANIRIGKITLVGGNINFSDFFIKPNYTANLTRIAGSVGSLTPETAGEVELRGTVDNAAPVQISGRINPLASELFVDIAASARDIELPPLSPYSAKYAGYGIEKGKLSMDVKYLIENRKLSAENRVVLDQLTFGEKVESPTATKLPVLLAVALLKDRNGVIDVNLPVSGSIDDPKFSLGGIIVQVIVNLIVKAVTAPFALIGSLVGAGEELAFVEFAPGSAKIDAQAEAKLANIAKALNDRPALKLDVAGRIDAEADREALRQSSLDRQVRVQKTRALGKGLSAEDVSVEPAEYPKYLTAAYKAADFPKPRTFLGFLKDLPVAEMETLMLTHASASDEDLRQLANRRAQAVKSWLVETGKVPAERIFLTAPRMSADGVKDKGRASRVDFALK